MSRVTPDLTADVLGDQHGGEALARRVHRGREACRPAADHGDVVDGLELGRLAADEPVEQAGRGEVGELVVAADELVVKEDLRHAVAARALDHLEGQVAVVRHVGLAVRGCPWP